MKYNARAVTFLTAFFVLPFLAACGEGYDMVKIRGQVPYTEERTAGPGIAFVRAHMMPEKSVILETITAPAPVAAPPAPAQSAEPLFQQQQLKK